MMVIGLILKFERLGRMAILLIHHNQRQKTMTQYTGFPEARLSWSCWVMRDDDAGWLPLLKIRDASDNNTEVLQAADIIPVLTA